MSLNIQQQLGQLKADKTAFQTQAQADGLNLQAVRQQAISQLPANATEAQKQAAAMAAIQQAVQNANDPTLTQDLTKVQQDRAQLKAHGHHHHGGKPPAIQDQTVQNIINEGSSASVSDITSALSGLSSSDPNYATLESMLATAQAQQPANAFGTNLNYMS